MNSWPLLQLAGRASVIAVLLLIGTSCSAKPSIVDARDPRSPVMLVRTIALPNVRGRIDHMALDVKSNHLFVSELTNGSVDDVDLSSAKVAARITGLHEPQGIAWLARGDEVAVACGDGTVHFYNASDRREVARVSLGDDADNVRVDGRQGNLVVGYGSGALAVIDPATHKVIRTLTLNGHPEAFEIIGSRVFVNVPGRREIVVGNLDAAVPVAAIGTGARLGNYPMASESSGKRLAVAFRLPSSVAILDAKSAQIVSSMSVCGDADDLYFAGRELIIVCGEGEVDLASASDSTIVRVSTRAGARTGLLDPDTGRLFIAVPMRGSTAEVWQLSVRRR